MENETGQGGDPQVAEHLLDVCYQAYGVGCGEAAAVRREMRAILDEGDNYGEFWPTPLRDALERYIAARRAEDLLHDHRERYIRGVGYQTTSDEDMDFGSVNGGDADGSAA